METSIYKQRKKCKLLERNKYYSSIIQSRGATSQYNYMNICRFPPTLEHFECSFINKFIVYLFLYRMFLYIIFVNFAVFIHPIQYKPSNTDWLIDWLMWHSTKSCMMIWWLLLFCNFWCYKTNWNILKQGLYMIGRVSRHDCEAKLYFLATSYAA